ncbi:MAG: hypothetical protein ACU4EQ_08360 [Candidatus Nitrosoglobus sp.]|jgi:hypothetical protein
MRWKQTNIGEHGRSTYGIDGNGDTGVDDRGLVGSPSFPRNAAGK